MKTTVPPLKPTLTIPAPEKVRAVTEMDSDEVDPAVLPMALITPDVADDTEMIKLLLEKPTETIPAPEMFCDVKVFAIELVAPVVLPTAK